MGESAQLVPEVQHLVDEFLLAVVFEVLEGQGRTVLVFRTSASGFREVRQVLQHYLGDLVKDLQLQSPRLHENPLISLWFAHCY